MIPNLAKKIVEKSFKEVYRAQEKKRKENVKKLISFYNGDHKNYIKNYLDFDNLSDFPFYESNITKKIIKKKSRVYKHPPVRIFDGEQDENYNELIENKNRAFKIAERQTNLLGCLGNKIYYNEDKGKFEYKLIRQFEAFFLDDPLNPYGVKYPVANIDQKLVYEYWDAENHIFFDARGNKLEPTKFGWEDNINPYGFVPVVWMRNGYIIDDFYNTGGNADTLINANEQIDLALSAAAHKYRFNSFRSFYIAGTDVDDDELKISYNRAINLKDPDANIGSMNLDHSFKEDAEWIKFQIQLIERNYNLDISWGLSGSTSGFQLIVQNMANQDDIEDMMDITRDWEKQALRMENKIAEFHSIKNLPDPQNLHIDYAEVKTPMSQEEKNKKWKFEFDNNLATHADYWRWQNPDMTDEQIKEKYKEIEEEAKRVSEVKREVNKGETLAEQFGEEE